MKKLTLVGITLILVLVLSMLLAACGDDTTTTTAAPETTTTAAPETTTTAAPETTTTAASPETTGTTAGSTMDTSVVPNVEPIELSMVSFLPDMPPGGLWARDFIDKLVEYSGGAITVKFSGPESIPQMDQPAAVQRGTVDIGSVFSSFCDTLVPGTTCIGRAEYSPMQLRDGNPAFTYYEEEFAKQGIKYLGGSASTEPQVGAIIYLNVEIESLEDLKGLKIASIGGAQKAMFDVLGCTTVPIDFTEYFTSMERGTVDGYNIGLPGILDFGLTPVTKVMLNEPFSSCSGMMLMNLDKWNSLTPAQQEVVTKAMINSEIDVAELFTQVAEDVIAEISAEGVKIMTLSPEDSKAFYNIYRDSMWADDIERWPDIAPMLMEWLVDPDFPRA